jgi:oligoribonuclease (3'-5' exoribonuclease)
MRYVAIDIETTGLDPDYCQILQVAAVCDDWPAHRKHDDGGELPVARLPTFEAVLRHEVMHGEPVALNMNAELIGVIGKCPVTDGTSVPVSYRDRTIPAYFVRDRLFAALGDFLKGYLGEPPYVAAGRNVAGFDLQFFPDWARALFHYRCLDVSSMAMGAQPSLWQHTRLPSGDKILGHPAAHDALLDAWDVIRTVRLLYNDHPETNGG